MKKVILSICMFVLLLHQTKGQNVGIGTPNPTNRLHVAAPENTGIDIGIPNDPMGLDGGANHIRFYGYRDIFVNSISAKISAERTNHCCGFLSQGTDLAFYTAPVIGASNSDVSIERVRIKDNGFVGIGTAAPASLLHVNGVLTTTGFRLTTTPTAGYVLTSDGVGNGTWQPIPTTGIAGSVSSTATITHGSGFTVTNPSTGVYDISFSTALPSINAITANVITAYTPTSAYCAAASDCAVGNINNFVFNGISVINNTGTGCTGGGYANYTGMSANVNAGGTYTFSMQSDGFWNPEYWAMWVDWNQDGDFNDAGESVWNSGGDIWNPTGSLTVPLTAVSGPTRLRIRTSNGGIPGTGGYSGSCGGPIPFIDYGEVEDYTLIVSGGVVPFGVAHVKNLSVSGCTIVTTTLSGTPTNMDFSFQAK